MASGVSACGFPIRDHPDIKVQNTPLGIGPGATNIVTAARSEGKWTCVLSR